MELVTEENLEPKSLNLFLKAQNAIELKNFDYAISLLQSILKEVPGFVKGRELLRATQGARVGGQKKKGGLTLGGGMSKVKAKLKKDPEGALVDIEEKLNGDPYNIEANTLFYDAWMALKQPQMATFGLETIRQGHPTNTKNLHKLGDHYISIGDYPAAAKIFDQITEHDPSDGTARKKAKDASAMGTMKSTGIDRKGAGLRDLLKNQDETAALEAASRKGATREQMEARLAELGEQYAADPQNLHVVKDIASLYERLEDWENCASYFEYAFSISNADATLRRKAEEARDKQRVQKIKDLEAQIEGAGDDADDLRAQLEELKAASLEQQIAEARERVESNPTDPELRFDLGSHLYAAGQQRDAIPHLQKAKNNPHIRIRAMLMLGRCYEAMKMHDLAIKTLSEANGELHAMDGVKKEVLYTLGIIHDAVGDKEKSLEALKEIYNADYDYRDVAARVEGSYGDDD